MKPQEMINTINKRLSGMNPANVGKIIFKCSPEVLPLATMLAPAVAEEILPGVKTSVEPRGNDSRGRSFNICVVQKTADYSNLSGSELIEKFLRINADKGLMEDIKSKVLKIVPEPGDSKEGILEKLRLIPSLIEDLKRLKAQAPASWGMILEKSGITPRVQTQIKRDLNTVIETLKEIDTLF